MKKNDYKNISILISFILVFVLILLCMGYVFGSKIDWANQHIVFPELFRNLFYARKELIPSLSLNIGMGQSIFYISYYGLLSPIIILSYLLPFIPMHIYMVIISIISLISSVILFYKWILDKYDSKIAFIASILLLLNTTFFYHFHRHLMFVIYMPFLILALKGLDNYFKNKKITSLIINTFLVIMTSYYFGAYSCIVIFIYAIYLMLKNNSFSFKNISKVVYLEIISILLSCVLLIPTLYSLINGRIPTSTVSFNLIKLFSPFYNFNYTFYNYYYSWGLSFIYILAIIYGFISKNKSRIFISIIMTLIIVFPIFSFILNGGMYVDGKCYLPFLPLAILLVCDYIVDIKNNKLKINNYLKPIVIVSVVLMIFAIGKKNILILIVDSILNIVFLLKMDKFKNRYMVLLPTLVITLFTFIISSYNEQYIDIKTFNDINSNKYYELLNDIDDNLYRLSVEDNKSYTINKTYNSNVMRTSIYSSLQNVNYYNQSRNIFQNDVLNRDNYVLNQTSNILFNVYSGSKYLITSSTPLIGYNLVKTIDNVSLYRNDDVLPLMYYSNNIMSKREFDELGYPYQMDALLNYIVVDESIDNQYNSNINKIDLNYNIKEVNNLDYYYDNDHIIVNARSNASIKLGINQIEDQILIIKFKMNKAKDGYACSSDISINGINNSLSCSNWKYNNQNNTFEYVLSSSDIINDLDIKFSSDTFDISDIETYVMSYEAIRNLNNNIVKLDYKTEDNKIISEVSFGFDGYIKTTIPYEKDGYKLLIDGEESELIKVDDTYLGFKITSGNHKIEIIYDTPYLLLGEFLTFIGIIILIITIRKNKKNNGV